MEHVRNKEGDKSRASSSPKGLLIYVKTGGQMWGWEGEGAEGGEYPAGGNIAQMESEEKKGGSDKEDYLGHTVGRGGRVGKYRWRKS